MGDCGGAREPGTRVPGKSGTFAAPREILGPGRCGVPGTKPPGPRFPRRVPSHSSWKATDARSRYRSVSMKFTAIRNRYSPASSSSGRVVS
jgi:hypothetical protein